MKKKNQNLLLRIASAAILLPLVLWLTHKGGLPFALFGVIVAMAGAGEFIWMFERQLGPAEVYGVTVAGLFPASAWLVSSGPLAAGSDAQAGRSKWGLPSWIEPGFLLTFLVGLVIGVGLGALIIGLL